MTEEVAVTRISHHREARGLLKKLRQRVNDDDWLPEFDVGSIDAAAMALAREHFLAVRRHTALTLITAMEIGAELIAARLALQGVADAEFDRIATAATGYQHRRREEFVLLYQRLKLVPEDSPLRLLPVDSVKLLVAPNTPPEAVEEVSRLMEIGETPTVAEVREIVAESRASAHQSDGDESRPPREKEPRESDAMTPDDVRIRRMLRAVRKDIDKVEDIKAATSELVVCLRNAAEGDLCDALKTLRRDNQFIGPHWDRLFR